MMKHSCLRIVALLSLLLLSTVSHGVVPVKTAHGESPIRYYLGWLPAVFHDDVKEAGYRWNDTSVKNSFTFVQTPPSGSTCGPRNLQNAITMAIDFCSGSTSWGATLAITDTIYKVNGKHIDSDIHINGNVSWSGYDKSWSDYPSDLRRVMAHEFGHALGLDHSANSSDLMAPYAGNLIVPSENDIESLIPFYGRDPSYSLKLIASGKGMIYVSSNVKGTLWRDGSVGRYRDPDQMNCQGTCAHSVQKGLRLILTARPDPGSSFLGWEGTSCSGSTCDLSPMTGSRTLTAKFSGGSTAPKAPSRPEGVAATKGTYADKIEVRASAVEGATEYELFIAGSSAGAKSSLGIKKASGDVLFTVTGSTPGKTYYFFVKACNAEGCSTYSSGISGYIKGSDTGGVSVPAKPIVTATKDTYEDRIRVRVEKVTGATEYRLYGRNNAGEISHLATTKSTESGTWVLKTENGWTPGKIYTFYVKACNTEGCSPYSSAVTGSIKDSGSNEPGQKTATQKNVMSIARLYAAAFDRLPKDGGLNFWVDEFESGSTTVRIAGRFVDSPEFKKRYGSLSRTNYVRQLFRNVLGREAQQSGVDFWVGHLQSGTSRANVLERISASSENVTKTKSWAATKNGSGDWSVSGAASPGGGSESAGVPITDTIFVSGREWAQVDLFTKLSWSQINVVCSGGACISGRVLNGHDMTGWIWASLDDVNAMFNSYGVSPPLVGSASVGSELDSARWAENFFLDGWNPTGQGSGWKITHGHIRSRSSYSNLEMAVRMQLGSESNRKSDGAGVLPASFGVPATVGGWFYKR